MSRPLFNLFRFRKVGDKNLITNDLGRFAFLDDDELYAIARKRIGSEHPRFQELRSKGFILKDEDLNQVTEDLRNKFLYLWYGPTLHILVVTLRCNQVCTYCHASRASMEKTETDMSTEVADRCLDIILSSPSDSITIEFQGGEPLANFDIVKHVIEETKKRNHNKKVMFSLVTNLSLMDEEKLEYLVNNRIQICTSLDGPKELHDHNRRFGNVSSYEQTVLWMKRINQALVNEGLDPTLYHVEALVTVTRDHLSMYKEIVDEYVEQGCKAIFLRPLNPFGFAKNTARHIGYNAQEFLDFYCKAIDYIIDLNKQGVEIIERLSAIFLSKILTPDDPNYMDIRSPCGAGIGQIAYNYDGKVFTCDEGRMVYQMGDDAFCLGDVWEIGLDKIIDHETVKAMACASCLDAIPGCGWCAYKPYCGTCPVFNYAEEGNIFPTTPTNERCKINMGILDHLFLILKDRRDEIDRIFRRWIEVKQRPAYIHYK